MKNDDTMATSPGIAAIGADAPRPATGATCRLCAHPLTQTFCDLGMSPPCQTHIRPEELDEPESFYPLLVLVCDRCFLAQLEEHIAPEEIFSEYA